MGYRSRLNARLLARLLAAAALTLGALACSSCKRKTEERPKTEEAPPDRLAPGEVVEGAERAFGLPLPRASHVAGRFATSAHVTSTVTPEQLSNFVRKRVTEGKTRYHQNSASPPQSRVPRDSSP